MASQDVLSLSLDDIIRMRGRKRGSNSRQGLGRRSAGSQEHGISHPGRGGRARGLGRGLVRGLGVGRGRGRGRGLGRGRGRGQSPGRGRGARILASKFAVQRAGSRAAGRATSALRNRGTPGLGRGQSGQGRNRGGTQSGRGRGAQRGRGSSQEGGKIVRAGRGRGRGSLRGRGSITILRSRGGAIQRGTISQQQFFRQRSQQNITARDSSFRQRLARRKIQQARKTLVMSQQNNRAKARIGIVNAKRGIQEGMNPVRGAGSVVSLSSQHGLTVSIKNNIASNQTQRAGSAMKIRPRLNRSRIGQHPAASYAPAMFTVVNDQAYPPEPPLPAPLPPRKILKRSIVPGRDSRAGVASPVVLYSQQNTRPAPEPHRQILDPKVQKEIAMLQGKEVSLNNGPGPGVKGFRHIPSHTARSLNERFTEERMITT